MKGANEFKELNKVGIQDKRNLVISKTNKDKFALAQQLVFDEGGRKIGVFLKGAIFIDKDKLVDVRDAINEIIIAEGL